MKTTLKFPMILGIVLAVSGYTGAAYAAAPTITSVSPNSGPPSGGQTIRIRGTNFLGAVGGGDVVLVGGASATVTAATNTTTVIDVTTPAGASGAAGITINGTLINGFYSYSSRNTTLQVVVSATIAKGVILQWGNGTTNDDNGGTVHNATTNQFSSYAWTVKDSSIVVGGVNQLELSTSYRSDDATNGKTININNGVAGLPATITAKAVKSGTGTLLLSVPPLGAAADTFAIQGAMAAGALQKLGNASAVTLAAALTNGADQALVLQVDTPTSITAPNIAQYTVAQQFTVTLTGTAN